MLCTEDEMAGVLELTMEAVEKPIEAAAAAAAAADEDEVGVEDSGVAGSLYLPEGDP